MIRIMWFSCVELCWRGYLTAFIGLITIVVAVLGAGGTDIEYCLDEPFEAQCPTGQMISIQSARYGRMMRNRCIDKDYGYIGCHNNVTRVLVGLCSGRSHCNVLNLETVFAPYGSGNCDSDLKAFLMARYTCENVTLGDQSLCGQHGHMPVAATEGYLASAISLRYGYGAGNCPWFIQAQPGQHIQFTLHNFAGPSQLPAKSTNSQQPDYCRQFAIIQEDGVSKKIVACRNDARMVVYASRTHTVTVQLIVSSSPDQATYFALHYKVRGCELPALPPASHLVRKTPTSVAILCNHSSDAWELTCGTDSHWVGQAGNCSAAAIKKDLGSDQEMPYGVAIAIIVGVALLICGLIFLTGIFYLRRKDFVGRRNRMRLDSTGYTVVDGTEMMQMKRSNSARFTTHSLPPTPGKRRHPGTVEHSPMMRTHSLGRGSRGNNGEYAHIWEIRRPIPVSTPKVPGNVRSAPDGTSPCTKTKTLERSATAPQQVRLPLGRGEEFPPPPATFNTFKPLGDHVYESPRFAQFHRVSSATRPGSATPSSPMYFQVDTTGTVPRGRDKPIPPRRSLDQGDKNRLRTMGMSGSIRKEPELSESEEGKITV